MVGNRPLSSKFASFIHNFEMCRKELSTQLQKIIFTDNFKIGIYKISSARSLVSITEAFESSQLISELKHFAALPRRFIFIYFNFYVNDGVMENHMVVL